MPLVDLSHCRCMLICPRCRKALAGPLAALVCEGCGLKFASIGNWPILVDPEQSIVIPEHVIDSYGASPIERHTSRFRTRLKRVERNENDTATVFADRMVTDVKGSRGKSTRILVIGGGEIGNGLDTLYSRSDVELIAFDIYASANVQFVADGHNIPLCNAAVDGVIIQAVLEHVLDPRRVVAEIHRVLRPDGLVYADTPFMQQVHEGPYDFTRFTESGHRHLFAEFDLISSGAVAGLGTTLLWSMDYFMRGLTRSRNVGRLTRLLLAWLALLDSHMDARTTVDGASSVYFYGSKGHDLMTPQQAVDHYQGAQVY